MMDRPLEPAIRRKILARRAGKASVVLGSVAVALVVASSFLKTTVARDRIVTARVDVGPIESTISASGTVVPEVEQVLSSPVDARVLRILKRPGAAVAKGDPVVALDLSESTLALDRVRREIALKANQQERTRIDLESTLGGLGGQVAIKKLELQNAQATSERSRKLFDEGLLSDELRRQAELNEARAEVELRQLEESERIARRSNGTELRGLALEMETLRQEAAQSERQIELGAAKADRGGVVTWTVAEEGVSVRKGDPLARVADLTSFRVDATISDVHAGRVRVGMPARVDLEGAALNGSVARVLPTIQNGVVSFEVRLDDPSSPALRSNLRVDVLLVTGGKERALRVKKGNFQAIDGATEIFVLRGGRAVRTPVRLGAASLDRYEVLAGLSEGDEVIVSDTTSIQHLREVKVR